MFYVEVGDLGSISEWEMFCPRTNNASVALED